MCLSGIEYKNQDVTTFQAVFTATDEPFLCKINRLNTNQRICMCVRMGCVKTSGSNSSPFV